LFQVQIREDHLGFFEKPISMKMESHAAGAKFDCLLFGKDLTLQIYIFSLLWIYFKEASKAG
jgi:hypothetical protein